MTQRTVKTNGNSAISRTRGLTASRAIRLMVRLLYLVIAWLPVLFLAVAREDSPAAGGGGETLNAARLLERSWETLLVAGTTAALALVLGAFLVPILSRLRIPGRRFWLVCALLPLFIPPYVGAIAAVKMLGAQGWATRLVVPNAEQLSLGPTAPPMGDEATQTSGAEPLDAEPLDARPVGGINPALPLQNAPIFSRAGVIAVLVFSFLPLVVFGGWALLGLTDPSVEEWALLHASPGRVLRRVVLPRALPGLVVGAGVAFLMAMAEFGIPEALRSYPVLSVEVYTQMGVYYSPRAGALAGIALVGLALAGGAALWGALKWIRPDWRDDLHALSLPGFTETFLLPMGGIGTGESRRGRHTGASWGGWRGALVLAGLAGILLLPLGALLGTLGASSLESGGLKAWDTAWTTGRDELLTSAQLGLFAAGICVVLALGMTWGGNETPEPEGQPESTTGPGSFSRNRADRGDRADQSDRSDPADRSDQADQAGWADRSVFVRVRSCLFVPGRSAFPGRSACGKACRALLVIGLVFPVVMPGPVVATGWSRMLSELAGWGSGVEASGLAQLLGRLAQIILDGPGALMLAWAGRWTPVALGLIALGRRQVPTEWLEAARLEGAEWRWRLIHIEWPILRRPALAAGALIFCLSLGEVGASILLLPPGVTTLGVRLMTLMHYAPTDIVAAQSLMTVALGLAAAALALAAWKLRRRRS